MNSSFGRQFLALGTQAVPPALMLQGAHYRFARLFKHDFFALTALYERTTGPGCDRIVLKLGRTAPFLGIPLQHLGRWLVRHETTILRRLQDLPAAPRLLGRFEDRGLIYEFIPGVSLDEKPDLPDDFFDRLGDLLDEVHDRRILYIDANKRGNILLGDDGRPHIIDFQISLHIPALPGRLRVITDTLLARLAREDHYHICKHKRRLRPDLLNAADMQSRKISPTIALHRRLTRPITYLRRRLLAQLLRRNCLPTDQMGEKTPENTPHRWAQ